MIEVDVKLAIAMYKNYQLANRFFYKLCCMHDLVYTYTCYAGPVVRCPYALVTDNGVQCVVCSRISCLK